MTLYTAQRAISMAVFVARSVGDVVLLRTGQLSTEECAVRMSRRIEAAGGGAIKIAQLLSTRPDVVGTTVSASLANLQDAVTPMSTKEAQSVMATSGTQWPTSALHAVQDGPVASGSVACVYRWASEEHGDVALKIRRPQALRAIPADVQVLHGALRAAQIIPAIRATPALTMYTMLSDAMKAQLDLRAELTMLQAMRDAVENAPDIVMPRPIPQLSSESILAMSFLEGLRPGSFAQADASTAKAGITSLVRAIYKLLFEEGIAHVDLHQGNAYLLDSGGVALLDVGFAYKMSAFARDRFTRFFAGMVQGDGQGCAEILLSTTQASRNASAGSQQAFNEQIHALVDESCAKTVESFSLPTFTRELFAIQRRNGYYADPEMTFPLVSLMALEGTVRQFSPEMDFQIEAAPYLMSSLL